MMPDRVVDKLWQMWLPVQNALNIGTTFLKPDSSTTLTIPSTASLVITVAAYNALTFSYADFSGRGPTQIYEGESAIKPDLAAPGVRVLPCSRRRICRVHRNFICNALCYRKRGTFDGVGIVKGNDPYLYGEKVKAYLRRGRDRFWGMRGGRMGSWGMGRTL